VRIAHHLFGARCAPYYLILSLLLVGCLIDGFLVEPKWIIVREIELSQKPTCRIVHISDIHYKGDRRYLEKIVRKINEFSPDFVCFTGDMVEDKIYLEEALEILSQIRCPVFGVPGNHDYWSRASFDDIAESFEATGGAWLVDEEVTTADGKITIVGATGKKTSFEAITLSRRSGEAQSRQLSHVASKRILLTHYPDFVNKLKSETYSLILAGHSHGGQIRLPFWGALILPVGVGDYDKGLFQTPSGSIYVNVGIGTYSLPVRFFCRPEITLIQL